MLLCILLAHNVSQRQSAQNYKDSSTSVDFCAVAVEMNSVVAQAVTSATHFNVVYITLVIK